MNEMGRYSSVAIREENVLEGNMEEFMIDGVTDVLKKLPYKPKAVLLFISCQHFFLAYDQEIQALLNDLHNQKNKILINGSFCSWNNLNQPRTICRRAYITHFKDIFINFFIA